jgi:hypothetical protein
MKDMMGMYQQMPKLTQTLLELGGDKEMEKIKKLNGMVCYIR